MQRKAEYRKSRYLVKSVFSNNNIIFTVNRQRNIEIAKKAYRIENL